jgi:hypothetical protein
VMDRGKCLFRQVVAASDMLMYTTTPRSAYLLARLSTVQLPCY